MSVRSKNNYIYESPDKGKTVYKRYMGSNKKELVIQNDNLVNRWAAFIEHILKNINTKV